MQMAVYEFIFYGLMYECGLANDWNMLLIEIGSTGKHM